MIELTFLLDFQELWGDGGGGGRGRWARGVESEACLCTFPSRQSIPDYCGVMSPRCTSSEDKLHGETEKWLLRVGNCTLVTVMQHLFKGIISTDSHRRRTQFAKRLCDALFALPFLTSLLP